MDITGIDSLHARRTLDVAGQQYDYFSIAAAAEAVGFDEVSRSHQVGSRNVSL